jgi:hypothetical protein
VEQPVRDTTSAESGATAPLMSKEELQARIAELEATLPPAPEPVSVPYFRAGVVCFRDNVLAAVSPNVDVMWPLIQDHIARLLEQLQPVQMVRHSITYWRHRFDLGCSLPLAFSNPEGTEITDAGLINCELDHDGKQMVGLMVYTLRDLDLQHAARLAEIVALKWGAERVKVWTPIIVPLIPGYEIEAAHYGQLQVAPVRPIQ